MSIEQEAFAHWCIVELLGHRRLAGYITEVQIAGTGFLRLDIPATDPHPEQTQIVSPSSVYALHPVDEATARAVASQFRPQPVHQWELTGGPATRADRVYRDPMDDADDELEG